MQNSGLDWANINKSRVGVYIGVTEHGNVETENEIYALKGYGPLYFTWDYGSSGHAVVIGGFDKKLNQFKVWNPYNRFEPGTVEIDWFTPDAFRERLHAGRWALQAWWR